MAGNQHAFAAGKPRPAELNLDDPEFEGILQRLAAFEHPARIARGYAIPERVVRTILQHYGDEIHQLRRSWKKWIATVEPLCNKTNRIIFLGNMARRAAKEGLTKDAIAAANAMAECFESEGAADVQDLAVLARIRSGDFQFAERMSDEEDQGDLEQIVYTRGTVDNQFARYHAPDPAVEELRQAVEGIPDKDVYPGKSEELSLAHRKRGHKPGNNRKQEADDARPTG